MTKTGEPIALDEEAVAVVTGGESTTGLDIIGADPYGSGDMPSSTIGGYTPPAGQYDGSQDGGDQDGSTAETDARHIRLFS